MNDDCITKFLSGRLGVMTLTKLARLLNCPLPQAEFVLARLAREGKIYQVKNGEWYPKNNVMLRMNGGRINNDVPSQVKPPRIKPVQHRMSTGDFLAFLRNEIKENR